ncbi:MAG: phosphoribosylglycinamide formyltransferase [Alphaproteobacteria bacterium]
MARRRVAVLISGRGSNLEALLKAAESPSYPAEIALVISNRPNAPGLAHAEKRGIATIVIDHKDFATRTAFEAALDEALRRAQIELICLAGFMRVLGSEFISAWPDKILNIHPSLLPSFPGLRVQAQALQAGVKISGCTVHIVRPSLDDGPIIAQAAVPVLENDDEAQLTARILAAEHQLYPQALAVMARGEAIVRDNRVEIHTGSLLACAENALFAPLIKE